LAQCVSEKRACKACLPAAKFLLTQVRQGRTQGQAEAAYRARFSPDQVQEIDVGGSPSKGPDAAPVTVIEWADFECPACRAAKPMLEATIQKYPERIRFVFKHFPLAIHENAEKAARAAVAAQRQGKFWEMHAGLFDKEPPLGMPVIERIAKSIDLDVERWKTDLESEAVADAVARDRKQGEKVELTGTPTIFINGRRFLSAGDQEADFMDWIKLELELAGASSKSARPQKPSPASKKPSASAAPAKALEVQKPPAAVEKQPAPASAKAPPAAPSGQK
jgi:protein-disulfide isomerase